MLQKYLQLVLTHGREHFEGSEELDTSYQVTLNRLLDDTHVGLPIKTGDLAGLVADVGDQVALRLDKVGQAKLITGSYLANLRHKPDLLREGLISEQL